MPASRVNPTWFFVATAIASLATVLGPYAIYGLTETGFQLAARYTVRVSFPLFLLAYIARPLAHIWRHNTSRWLLRHRRYLGLSFALAHTVHLGALTAFFVYIGESPSIDTLIGGGGAYLAMFAMAATSNNVSVQKLGTNWHRLHLIGMHYLWFIFAFSYLGRWMGGRGDATDQNLMLVGVIGTTLCLGAMGLRVLAYWKRQTRRQPA